MRAGRGRERAGRGRERGGTITCASLMFSRYLAQQRPLACVRGKAAGGVFEDQCAASDGSRTVSLLPAHFQLLLPSTPLLPGLATVGSCRRGDQQPSQPLLRLRGLLL